MEVGFFFFFEEMNKLQFNELGSFFIGAHIINRAWQHFIVGSHQFDI